MLSKLTVNECTIICMLHYYANKRRPVFDAFEFLCFYETANLHFLIQIIAIPTIITTL